MDFIPITSSNIAAAAWQDSDLYLQFHNGSTYRYQDVPMKVFNELITAPSAGKYFHAEIRAKYEYAALLPIT